MRGFGYDECISDETNLTFVDVDRFNFINQLHIAYFLSLSEICGLNQHISQNFSALRIGTMENL